jgi:hypothetical protein
MGIREELCECYGDDLLFADGYDSAIIGVCGGCDSGRVAYDAQKMVEICVNEGMNYDEANEWLEFNTFCAYVGEHTPLYVFMKEQK